MKGKFIVVCGPSGVGKSTLIFEILKQMSHQLGRTVSYTTRKERSGEKDGEDYFFISKEEFLKKKEAGEFIEWTYVYNDYYATAKKQLDSIWSQGKSIIKDLDLSGLKSLKKRYPQSLGVGIVSSKDEIRKRLSKRNEEPGLSLENRLVSYTQEIKECQKLCDVSINNDHLETAVFELKKEIEKYLS